MSSTDPPTKPFIRFKHHINTHITAGLQSLLNLPSAVAARTFPPSPAPSDIEARLSRLRGGSLSDALLAWHLFATASPYSPLRLSSTLAWRPTPKDCPVEAAGEFGWVDAFEDLLLVSAGRGLSDLRQRHVFNKVLGRATVGGALGDAEAVVFVGRLLVLGVAEVYFPLRDRRTGYQSPSTAEEWRERNREREGLKGLGNRVGEGDELRKELQGAVKALRRVLEDEEVLKRFEQRRPRPTLRPELDKEPESSEDQLTEEDLYRAFSQSAHAQFEKAERSIYEFFKIVSEQESEEAEQALEWEKLSGRKAASLPPAEDGYTKTVTKNEYMDAKGNIHVKTEVSRKNAQGVEIMRRVNHSIRSPPYRNDAEEGVVEVPQQAEKQEVRPMDEQRVKESNGWFWK
ncbi:hypothetical protein B0T25DRAFT_537945 [Lasiosphaeria hispida]|uniref:Uncharacterized protein n=1 Tax=Lasiosphaeria hispida TaxID=260671 RepID=A0AAJ0HLU6_9PEZI|nr:hypothetical protein B0T25DRAFT_537945 [Lasiosphaeria hispida]